MSFTRYTWRVYCLTTNSHEFVISSNEPLVCPVDGGPIDRDRTTIMQTEFTDLYSDGYINIESDLADSSAIRINNLNANGGVDINAGFGGLTMDSNNSISLDASAYSNFTAHSGNLELEATNGGTGALINMDADAGINIGCDASVHATHTPIINLGTNTNARAVTIGNNNTSTTVLANAGASQVSLNNTSMALTGGSSGISMNSSGIVSLNSTNATDGALRVTAVGGLDLDVSGPINLATGNNSGGAITLDAAFNNGGINISAGSMGIAINAGTIGIGHWSGGDIYLGTAGVSRGIAIGNATGSTSVSISSGGGGIVIGGNANGGEIHIGNVAFDKTFIIGNNTGATRMFQRFGTSGFITSQQAHVAYSDADHTATAGEMLNGLFNITPTATRTITLPTAAAMVAGIPGAQVSDSIKISVINSGASNNVVLAVGTGGTAIGNMTVLAQATGTFRLRLTNVTGSSEAYTIYRAC